MVRLDQLNSQLEREGLVVRPVATAAGSAQMLLSVNGAYRYALSQFLWGGDAGTAVFVMLRPDRYEGETIRSCVALARLHGFGQFVAVSAFAAWPGAFKLPEHPDPVGPSNDKVIAAVIAAAATEPPSGGPGTPGTIIAMWGTDPFIYESGRVDELMELICASGSRAQCLGHTITRHPLLPGGLPHRGHWLQSLVNGHPADCTKAGHRVKAA